MGTNSEIEKLVIFSFLSCLAEHADYTTYVSVKILFLQAPRWFALDLEDSNMSPQ